MSFVEVPSQPNPTSQPGPGPWSIPAFIPPSLSVDPALGSSSDTGDWIGPGLWLQGSCVLVGETRRAQEYSNLWLRNGQVSGAALQGRHWAGPCLDLVGIRL